MVEWLFLAVPWGCLRFVIVVFPVHTHLLFFRTSKGLQPVLLGQLPLGVIFPKAIAESELKFTLSAVIWYFPDQLLRLSTLWITCVLKQLLHKKLCRTLLTKMFRPANSKIIY